MGWKDANWAYTLDLPMIQKAVLVAICHRTDDKTHSTLVGHGTIADMLGVHRSTVTTAVGALARLGIITRERRTEGQYRTSDRTIVNRANVGETNVGESNVGETNVAEDANQRWRDRQQVELRSTGQPDGQPDLLLEAFEQAYAAWPKKVERKMSLRAFTKAAKTRGLDELTADVIRFGNAYAASTERQYVPALSAWLNGERWTDELPAPKMPTQAEWDAFLGDGAPRSKAAQNAVAYDRIFGGQTLTLACTEGEHRWMPDGTCNFCTARKDEGIDR